MSFRPIRIPSARPNFFQAFADGFEKSRLVSPLQGESAHQWKDDWGNGEFLCFSLVPGICAGEFEWRGQYDLQVDTYAQSNRFWIAILLEGNCNLYPLESTSFERIEQGRCVVFQAEKIGFQASAREPIRGILFEIDGAFACRSSLFPQGAVGESATAPVSAASPARLSFLSGQMNAPFPEDLTGRLERISFYCEWIAKFVRSRESSCDLAALRPAARRRMETIADFLRKHPGMNHSIASLCRNFHLNEFTLKHDFKAVFGSTVFGYLRMVRMEMAAKLLRQREMSVIEIAMEVGHSNPSHFSKVFREYHGCRPSEFR